MLSRDTTILTDGGFVELSGLSGGESLLVLDEAGRLSPGPLSGIRVKRCVGGVYKVEAAGCTMTCSAGHPLLMSAGRRSRRSFVDIVLVERQGRGAALGLSSSTTSRAGGRLYGYRRLPGGAARSADEALWLIERHGDRRRAELRLHLLACRYSLPMVKLESASPGLERGLLDELFDSLDTAAAAERLRRDHHLQDDKAHFVSRLLDDTGTARSLFVELLLFAGKPGHALTIHALSDTVADRSGALSPRPLTRITFDRVEQAFDYLAANCSGTFVDVQVGARLGGRDYVLLPAAYLRKGMCLPRLEAGRVSAAMVDECLPCEARGLFYSLSAETSPVLVAGGGLVACGEPWPPSPSSPRPPSAAGGTTP